MRLLCSSFNCAHALYHHELADLAEQHPWLEVVHSFTRDPNDRRTLYYCRIDHAMLADLVEGFEPELAYICGPPDMVTAIALSLADLGVDPCHLRTEKYD